MIKRWLDKRMSKRQQEEAEHYLTMLKGANSNVIDMVALSTMVWAARMEQRGTNLYNVSYWINEEPMMAYALAELIKRVQSTDPEDANGLMVWLHTVRAAQWPELKHTARLIWHELQRAPSDAAYRARQIARDEGIDNPTCGLFPPVDFELVR